MNKNIDTHSLVEAAMVCGILVIFAMISFYALPFLDFIFPLPAILLGKRRGCKYTALSMVAASLIIFMLLGFQVSIMYLIMYTPIAITMVSIIQKNKKPSVAIIAGSIAMLISLVVMLYVVQTFTGIRIADKLVTMLNESFELQKQMFSNSASFNEELAMLTEMHSVMVQYTVILIPTFLLIGSFFLSAINYVAACFIGKKLKIEFIPINDFSRFILPRNFILGLAVMSLLAYFLTTIGFPNANAILINIFVMGYFLLLAQGLAILKYYFISRNVGNIIRVLVFFCILFMFLLQFIVIMISVLDVAMDFRKLRL